MLCCLVFGFQNQNGFLILLAVLLYIESVVCMSCCLLTNKRVHLTMLFAIAIKQHTERSSVLIFLVSLDGAFDSLNTFHVLLFSYFVSCSLL